MAYQSRSGSPRNSGRGRGIPRHEKAKRKEQKQRNAHERVLEENQSTTVDEIADRTINALRNLGNQRFALPPFSEHLDRWTTDLKQVLFDFESRPDITIDEQFEKERTQILSNIKLDPQKRKIEETHSMEDIEKLKKNKKILETIETNYAKEKKQIEERHKNEVEHVTKKIDEIKNEQNRISKLKTGFFRTLSQKAKAHMEADASNRLTAVQNELSSLNERFMSEQKTIREKYDNEKHQIAEQIKNSEKQVQDQETDDTLEIRHATSEALINTVSGFLHRKGLLNH